MKKLWRTLPHFARWLLVTLLIMALVAGGGPALMVRLTIPANYPVRPKTK